MIKNGVAVTKKETKQKHRQNIQMTKMLQQWPRKKQKKIIEKIFRWQTCWSIDQEQSKRKPQKKYLDDKNVVAVTKIETEENHRQIFRWQTCCSSD